MNRYIPRRVVALSVAALTVTTLGVLSGGTPAAADTTAPVITLQHPTTVAVPTAAATGWPRPPRRTWCTRPIRAC